MKPFDTLAAKSPTGVSFHAPVSAQSVLAGNANFGGGATAQAGASGLKSYEMLPSAGANTALAGRVPPLSAGGQAPTGSAHPPIAMKSHEIIHPSLLASLGGVASALRAPRPYEMTPGGNGAKAGGCGCGGKCGPCGTIRSVGAAVATTALNPRELLPRAQIKTRYAATRGSSSEDLGAHRRLICMDPACQRWQQDYLDNASWAQRMGRVAAEQTRVRERAAAECRSGAPLSNCDALQRARTALGPSIVAAAQRYQDARRYGPANEERTALEDLNSLAEMLQDWYQSCVHPELPTHASGREAECRYRENEASRARWYEQWVYDQIDTRNETLRMRHEALEADLGCECPTPEYPPGDPFTVPDLAFLDDF